MATDERDPLFESEHDSGPTDQSMADDVVWDSGDVEDAIQRAESAHDDPVTQLEELVRWLVSQLVDEPEKIIVEANERGSTVQVQVRLPEQDLGKVIGRGGRIAKSMRTALMIVGSRHHLRVSLDIEGQS